VPLRHAPGSTRLDRKAGACRPAECPDRPAMTPFLIAIYQVVDLILSLFVWLLIASAIMSWLFAFGVVNTRNQFVRMLAEFLYRITEPVLRPIRGFIPSIGGIDLSPIVVIIAIFFIRTLMQGYLPYLL
jgi:YggT family protein